MTDTTTSCSSKCWLYDYDADIEHPEAPQPSVSAEEQAATAAALYTPIKPWQTRIVRLLPAPPSEPLEAELYVTYMTEAPGMVLRDQEEMIEYSALSYCWGEPIYDHRLRVNTVQYPVTRTLFQALHRLRSTSEARFVWIDALCIQQCDHGEQSNQVANMLQIYQKASEVAVWLGEHDQWTKALFHCATNFEEGDRPMDGTADISDGREAGTANISDESENPSLCKVHTTFINRGLRSIIYRPWFSRLWVKQEVWAARALHVMCGPETISWSQLESLLALARRIKQYAEQYGISVGDSLESTLHDQLTGLQVASAEDHIRAQLEDRPNPFLEPRDHRHPRGSDIVTILRHSVNSKSTNPVDRIYALLGMTATNVSKSGGMWKRTATLTIDYGKTAAEVFEDLTRYIIKRDGCLAVLLLDATFGTDQDGTRLSTWAIDWRQPTSTEPWVQLHQRVHEADEKNRFEASPAPPDQQNPQSSVLALYGVCAGMVLSEVKDAEWRTVSPPKGWFEVFWPHSGSVGAHRNAKRRLLQGHPYRKRRKYPDGSWEEYILQPVDFVHENTEAHRPGRNVERNPETRQVTLSISPNESRTSVPESEKIVYQRFVNEPLMATGVDHFAKAKQVSVVMRSGTGFPDYIRQPNYRFGHRSPHCEPDGIWLSCSHERDEEVNDGSPFKIRPDGGIESFWTVPFKTEAGDLLVFFDDSSLGMMVRPTDGEKRHHTYIGPAMINRGPWCGVALCSESHLPDGYDPSHEARMFVRLKEWFISSVPPDGHELFKLI